MLDRWSKSAFTIKKNMNVAGLILKPCKKGKLKVNGSYKGKKAKFGPTETFSYMVTKKV